MTLMWKMCDMFKRKGNMQWIGAVISEDLIRSNIMCTANRSYFFLEYWNTIWWTNLSKIDVQKRWNLLGPLIVTKLKAIFVKFKSYLLFYFRINCCCDGQGIWRMCGWDVKSPDKYVRTWGLMSVNISLYFNCQTIVPLATAFVLQKNAS